MHASSGILYNHESPRRPRDFVTRKVAHAAAAISLGLENEVLLGSLEARRDWGYARDYVRAMWLALQQDEPDDYVLATGESHSVRELAEIAFAHVGLDYEEHVRVDDSFVRGKAELYDLLGDASRARERLGWTRSIDFEGLVQLLVDSDLERLRAQLEKTESVTDV
jgi:GDPmannose 4,6-dehydratase